MEATTKLTSKGIFLNKKFLRRSILGSLELIKRMSRPLFVYFRLLLKTMTNTVQT